MSSDVTTLHLIISGRVQGVGYRAWAQRSARKLGLSGWVRNLTDGSVEAVVRGPVEVVNQFVGACQAGPTLARVTAVDTVVIEKTEVLTGFEQRETVPPPQG
jgi:acylphosphatase